MAYQSHLASVNYNVHSGPYIMSQITSFGHQYLSVYVIVPVGCLATGTDVVLPSVRHSTSTVMCGGAMPGVADDLDGKESTTCTNTTASVPVNLATHTVICEH